MEYISSPAPKVGLGGFYLASFQEMYSIVSSILSIFPLNYRFYEGELYLSAIFNFSLTFKTSMSHGLIQYLSNDLIQPELGTQ